MKWKLCYFIFVNYEIIFGEVTFQIIYLKPLSRCRKKSQPRKGKAEKRQQKQKNTCEANGALIPGSFQSEPETGGSHAHSPSLGSRATCPSTMAVTGHSRENPAGFSFLWGWPLDMAGVLSGEPRAHSGGPAPWVPPPPLTWSTGRVGKWPDARLPAAARPPGDLCAPGSRPHGLVSSAFLTPSRPYPLLTSGDASQPKLFSGSCSRPPSAAFRFGR